MKKGENEELKWSMKKPDKNVFGIRVELEELMMEEKKECSIGVEFGILMIKVVC
jgi:hypothetical protein